MSPFAAGVFEEEPCSHLGVREGDPRDTIYVHYTLYYTILYIYTIQGKQGVRYLYTYKVYKGVTRDTIYRVYKGKL